jgi:hypothetical protein
MKRKRAALDVEGSIDNLLATPELRSLYPAAMRESSKEAERAARILLACEHVFAHRDAGVHLDDQGVRVTRVRRGRCHRS